MPTFEEIRKQIAEKEARKIQLEAEQRAKQARFEEESERLRKKKSVIEPMFMQAEAYYNDSSFPELISVITTHLHALDDTYVDSVSPEMEDDGSLKLTVKWSHEFFKRQYYGSRSYVYWALDKWFHVIVFSNGTIKVEGWWYGRTTLRYSEWHNKPDRVAERALEKASEHPYWKIKQGHYHHISLGH